MPPWRNLIRFLQRILGREDDEKPEFAFLKPAINPAYLGMLGRYLVTKSLGAGGMGTVLLAVDPTRNRQVAIKVLHEELAGHMPARRRFLREGRIAMSIHHPNVLATYAIERDRDCPFIVSDYMPGGSLQQLIDEQGPLPVKPIVDFAIQIARGIAAIHNKNLVHSDIKPSNILLDESHQIAKICDFGLARVLNTQSTYGRQTVIASVHYASPEQVQGFAFDHRSDLFSMGSVLYAMCTARPPFPGESTVAVARELCNRDPRPIQDSNPAVPNALVAVVAKLMSKYPSSRYQTAREVEVALEELCRHANVQADSSSEPGETESR